MALDLSNTSEAPGKIQTATPPRTTNQNLLKESLGTEDPSSHPTLRITSWVNPVSYFFFWMREQAQKSKSNAPNSVPRPSRKTLRRPGALGLDSVVPAPLCGNTSSMLTFAILLCPLEQFSTSKMKMLWASKKKNSLLKVDSKENNSSLFYFIPAPFSLKFFASNRIRTENIFPVCQIQPILLIPMTPIFFSE